MKIGFYTFEKYHNRKPESIGSTRIRARWVWENWPEATEYQIGERYDVVIFQKVYQIEYAKSIKGIKILDICDPDWLDGAPVVEMIEHVDAVTTPTDALTDYLKTVTDKPVYKVPDRVKFEEAVPKRGVHEGRGEKVVWFGYGQNQKYLDQTIDVLKNLNLKLTVISNVSYQPNLTFKYDVDNIEYNQDSFNKEMIRHDMVLLPPPYGLKGKFKSNNKDLIAWSLNMPVAKEPDDLKKLIDPDARNKEVKEKTKELTEKYDVKLSVKQYQEIIKEVKKNV